VEQKGSGIGENVYRYTEDLDEKAERHHFDNIIWKNRMMSMALGIEKRSKTTPSPLQIRRS
jgi:hypothetical protein